MQPGRVLWIKWKQWPRKQSGKRLRVGIAGIARIIRTTVRKKCPSKKENDMSKITSNADALETLRKVRQVRQFVDGDVSEDQLNQLLEIARWTGSSRNTQPW